MTPTRRWEQFSQFPAQNKKWSVEEILVAKYWAMFSVEFISLSQTRNSCDLNDSEREVLFVYKLRSLREIPKIQQVV